MTHDRDPDGFDAKRREELDLRFVALEARQDRDALVASLSPLELAQHDLAAMLEYQKQYEAGETLFPVPEANTEAVRRSIEELRALARSLEPEHPEALGDQP